MNISLFDICERSTMFAGTILMQGSLTETKIEKNTVGFSLENRTYVANMIAGALDAYHSALRESLLEKGIDIGDFVNGINP